MVFLTTKNQPQCLVLLIILVYNAAEAFVTVYRRAPITEPTADDLYLSRTRQTDPLGRPPRLHVLGVSNINTQLIQTQDAPLSAPEPPVPKTLRAALQVFFLDVYNGPRIVVGAITGLVAWRVKLLPYDVPSLSEAMLAVAVVGFWCVQEHVLHKQVLHSQRDWLGKRIHQGHHDRNYFHISIDPAPLMISWMSIVSVGLFLALPTQALALTASAAYAISGLWYEWTHFIVHTKVRFRAKSYFDVCKTHHARHHMVDSNHWLAFSYPGVDDWFGTNPKLETIRQQRRRSTED